MAFDYCINNNLIGTGWGSKKLVFDKNVRIGDNFINHLKKIYYSVDSWNKNSFNSFKIAMNCLNSINLNDIIWTRCADSYYMAKVKSLAKSKINPNPEYPGPIDVYNYVDCEFVKVKNEEVIGPIYNSFNQGTIRRIKANNNVLSLDFAKEYSKYLWNKYSDDKYSDVNIDKYKKNIDILLDVIDSSDLEELVGLYLQLEMNYGIYTSTNKRDTKSIEFVLFNRDNPNIKAKLQVKNNEIDLSNYSFDSNYIYYFYSNCNKYKNKYENKNIRFIMRDDLINFIKKYKNRGLLLKIDLFLKN